MLKPLKHALDRTLRRPTTTTEIVNGATITTTTSPPPRRSERADPLSWYAFRRARRQSRSLEETLLGRIFGVWESEQPMADAEIRSHYAHFQADRQRQAAETEAALARDMAEREAGIPRSNDSTVPWQQGRRNGGGWLDRQL
jgi:hypothetical protein